MKKRFYIIGIAGVATASLAGLLKEKDYEVAGSDMETYPPMSNLLREKKIKVFSPYKSTNIKTYKPDLVIVGNAIGRGNPELEFVMESGLKYRSLPEILKEEFIEGKNSIVITGTHGKTTTTSILSWILKSAKKDPTIFVGGIMKNLNSSFYLGKGKEIVIEGDEYDTAFFDKGPKFWHYRPFVGILNNVELDHVDIYKDLDAVKFAFARFINLIPQNGLLIVGEKNKTARDLAKEKAKSPLITFGIKTGDYKLQNLKIDSHGMSFEVLFKNKNLGRIETSLSGKYNSLNILAAIAAARFLKIPWNEIARAIKTFEGVKRRAEVLGEVNGITIIDDFAHHPTAVSETVEALRAKFPKRRIVALFEPGSATSKRKIFEKDFARSLGKADGVFLFKPAHAKNIPSKDLFSGKRVAQEINSHGIHAEFHANTKDLLKALKKILKSGDVLVFMASRDFDGLRESIFKEL